MSWWCRYSDLDARFSGSWCQEYRRSLEASLFPLWLLKLGTSSCPENILSSKLETLKLITIQYNAWKKRRPLGLWTISKGQQFRETSAPTQGSIRYMRRLRG